MGLFILFDHDPFLTLKFSKTNKTKMAKKKKKQRNLNCAARMKRLLKIIHKEEDETRNE